MSEDNETTYSIGEASERTGLPESTIRFYDREFEEYLGIQRNENNQRTFTDENLKDLEYIRYLIKREDMSVDEVAERLERERELKTRHKQVSNTGENSGEESTELTETVEQLRAEIRELRTVIHEQHESIEHLEKEQNNIAELLDMNLQRYNELVEHLPG